jgi:predicted secreted protein
VGLAEAVADAIDILRGRPACGGEGRDDWERMVAIIAENDSLPNNEVTRIERAIDEAYRGWPRSRHASTPTSAHEVRPDAHVLVMTSCSRAM